MKRNILIFSTLLGTSALLGGCLEDKTDNPSQGPAPAAAEEKSSNREKHDLLHRMEFYSRHKQATDLYTYPARDDGQFTSIIVDSADKRMQIYTDIPTGYAFMMDHINAKKIKDPYELKDIKLVENHVDETENMHSFEIHLVHPSAKNRPEPKRQNDTQTNLKELEFYGQYQSLFTLGASRVSHDGEVIPAFAEFDSPAGKLRVESSEASDVIDDYRNTYHYMVKGIERKSVDMNGSDNYTGYVIKLDK